MKRMIVIIVAGIIMFSFSIDKIKVQAEDNTCDTIGQLLQDNGANLKTTSGATVTMIKDGPQNVVVYGQDLVDKRGVDITVTVTSQHGEIEHDEWVDQNECLWQLKSDSNKTKCQNSTYGYYYWHRYQKCEPMESTDTFRHIKDVRIWLQPSQNTSGWLGWNPITVDGNTALRYLYPEKWMVGNWTNDGFTTQGTANLQWNSQYYQTWLNKMKGYNFLAGDSLLDNALWSITLAEVSDPLTAGVTSLGLYGDFDRFPGANTPSGWGAYSSYAVNCADMVASQEIDSMGDWAPTKASCEPQSPLPTTDSDNATIKLRNIPLDLPGKWTIGIMVEMEKAYFYYGTKGKITENVNWGIVGDTKWFRPPTPNNLDEIGYNMDDENSSFYSYVMLSTPCNIQETLNCFDTTH